MSRRLATKKSQANHLKPGDFHLLMDKQPLRGYLGPPQHKDDHAATSTKPDSNSVPQPTRTSTSLGHQAQTLALRLPTFRGPQALQTTQRADLHIQRAAVSALF